MTPPHKTHANGQLDIDLIFHSSGSYLPLWCPLPNRPLAIQLLLMEICDSTNSLASEAPEIRLRDQRLLQHFALGSLDSSLETDTFRHGDCSDLLRRLDSASHHDYHDVRTTLR
jgi:hypothetical protein